MGHTLLILFLILTLLAMLLTFIFSISIIFPHSRDTMFSSHLWQAVGYLNLFQVLKSYAFQLNPSRPGIPLLFFSTNIIFLHGNLGIQALYDPFPLLVDYIHLFAHFGVLIFVCNFIHIVCPMSFLHECKNYEHGVPNSEIVATSLF